ncbi:MAG: VWA domain-containing protein [Vicinamibacterales bacterium]
MSDDELAIARSALTQLTWNMDERRTRRWVAGRGRRIDLRRALARSLRTGGEIATLPTRHRRTRTRPIVLLCDVSGSMERYTRTLLLFAHGLSRDTRRVEAFLFATRLTRITMELRSPKPDAAITAVSPAVRDWSGGTRIGEALRSFHQRWRRRTLRSESVVIVISDGWDRGDPALLRNEIARLQRSCHRLIWLNPLIGSADYAPLTRGLQAALPHVDDFLPVRTLRDVRDLALHLSALTGHGHHRHLHLRRAAAPRLDPADGSGADRIVHPGM